MLQKLDNFLQFLFRLFGSRHIGKGNLDFLLVMQFGAAFAERHNPAATALGLLHDKKPYTNQQQHR